QLRRTLRTVRRPGRAAPGAGRAARRGRDGGPRTARVLRHHLRGARRQRRRLRPRQPRGLVADAAAGAVARGVGHPPVRPLRPGGERCVGAARPDAVRTRAHPVAPVAADRAPLVAGPPLPRAAARGEPLPEADGPPSANIDAENDAEMLGALAPLARAVRSLLPLLR